MYNVRNILVKVIRGIQDTSSKNIYIAIYIRQETN